MQIPLNKLRKPKEKGAEEIIPFLFTHNPNNPNIFPIIRQKFENFNGEKLINFMCQAPNLERLSCKSKFMPVEENFHVNSCGRNCICCPYLLKISCYLFKRVNKVFFLKNNFNCKSRDLFMSLFVKAAKKSILVRLAVW